MIRKNKLLLKTSINVFFWYSYFVFDADEPNQNRNEWIIEMPTTATREAATAQKWEEKKSRHNTNNFSLGWRREFKAYFRSIKEGSRDFFPAHQFHIQPAEHNKWHV